MDWRIACVLMAAGLARAAEPVGLFADHSDVGTVLHPGSVVYDAAKRTYTIRGSGENVWATADAFQFVWKKMEGDFTLTADISVLGQGGDPHKKAMLMARQSLDADSAYADVALHGVGLTSLQSRDAKGADTHEIQSNISAPKRLRLQKHGDEFTMWLAGEDGVMRMAGGSMRVPLAGAFYVGIGVCAHNKDAVETAEFRNVALDTVSSEAPMQLYSTLETIDVASTDRRVTYVAPVSGNIRFGVAAPNWTPDGASLLFNRNGRIESIPVAGGQPKVIDTGLPNVSATIFHGISPDGTMLAVTNMDDDRRFGSVYVVPVGGGKARRVTESSSCLWQGWSPDGTAILFLGERNGVGGIYSIPLAGGEETRLADGLPHQGGPEFSPDGKYIYFNSNRSGATEIWRMLPDGSQPEEVTTDGAGNHFAHVSPDGRLVAFLTVQQRGAPLSSVPSELALRVVTLADRQIRVLARLTGNMETMTNPSWSPDSRRIAFVSYQGGELHAPAVVK